MGSYFVSGYRLDFRRLSKKLRLHFARGNLCRRNKIKRSKIAQFLTFLQRLSSTPMWITIRVEYRNKLQSSLNRRSYDHDDIALK